MHLASVFVNAFVNTLAIFILIILGALVIGDIIKGDDHDR